LIVDYQSSLLVVEARKRYRVLRGDKLEWNTFKMYWFFDLRFVR
jgi:hypothetical protein